MRSDMTLTELTPDQRAGLWRLFDHTDLPTWNVSIGAVLDGTSPGRAWADHPDTPRSAFLVTPEGSFLAGEPDNAAFHAALRRLIANTIFNPDAYGFAALVMTFDDAWRPYWDAIFPRPAIASAREFYRCTRITHDWRAALPAGYEVHRIDAALLADADVDVPDHVHGWIKSNWCKPANFLAHGFGFVTLHQTSDADDRARVSSWSIADGVSRDYAEIGIHTRPDYRQRGLAAITAAAAAEYALAQGYNSVGWHTHTTNPGSQRTARRAGFALERTYTHYLCYAREADHLCEIAHQHMLRGDTQAEADSFARASALDDARPHVCFYAACAFARLDEPDTALGYLQDAVARGWTDAAALRSAEALTPLHHLAGWQTLLNHLDHHINQPTQPEKEHSTSG